MAFTAKNWEDLPSTATPISAGALEDMENRLGAYAATAAGTELKGYTGLRVWGHSLASGSDANGVPVGVTDTAYRYTALMAGRLGVTEFNDNVGGSAITMTTLQGWDRVLSTWKVRAPETGVFPPMIGGYNLMVLHYGENDITRTTTPDTVICNAMRACLYHLRAAGCYENNHASVGAGGTNTVVGTRQLTNGQSFTISGAPLNASWPGGDVVLRFLAQTGDVGSAAINVDSGASTTAVDLTAAGQINSQAGQAGPIIKKLTLGPGAHTIQVTATVTGGTGIQFDAYTLHPDNFFVPTVVMPSAHKLSADSYYDFFYGASPSASAPNAPLRDSKIDTFNSALAGLASEFGDGRVVYVDIDSVINKTGFSDFIHPDSVHTPPIAEAVLDALPTLSDAQGLATATVQGVGQLHPVIGLTKAAATSVANNVITVVDFDTIGNFFDPIGILSADLVNNRVNVLYDCWVDAFACLQWATNATGLRKVGIRHSNSVGTQYTTYLSETPPGTISNFANAMLRCVAGDRLDVIAFQTSGGALGLQGTGIHNIVLRVGLRSL
jgi:hypothetical protein